MSTQLVLNTVTEACRFFAEFEHIQGRIYNQLLARDVAQLEKSIKAQANMLRHIRQNTELRARLLQGLGFSVDSGGMNRLLASLPEEQHQQGVDEWRKLETSIRHCKELNKLNGKVQARLGTVTRRLLSMIDEHYYKLSTYSPKGSPVAGPSGRVLGQA